ALTAPRRWVLRCWGFGRVRADRLHRLLVEHRFEGRAAIGRLPYPAARRADEQRHLPGGIGVAGESGNPAAHGGRTDVACAEAGDRAGIGYGRAAPRGIGADSGAD